jgi:hypothetical protein
MSQKDAPPLDRPWTEDEVIELLRIAYASDDVTSDEVALAARTALANEGEAIELGQTGRHLRFMPGAKKRLGLC